MFESAEIGHSLDKKTWKAREPELRAALLEMQFRLLREARCAVVILVNGVELAGRGETVNVLNEWMDPRHIRTEAFGPMNEGERQHPEMFRFWQVLPPKGHIGILFGNWYTDPLHAHAVGGEKHEHFVRRLERIRQFERMLAAEGVLLLKFWFHLSKKAAKARLKELQSNPKTAWRVTPQEERNLRSYDDCCSMPSTAGSTSQSSAASRRRWCRRTGRSTSSACWPRRTTPAASSASTTRNGSRRCRAASTA